MPPKAVVVLSGDAPPLHALAECSGAIVIAADGGANHLSAWRVTPHVVIGDMDSVHPDVLARAEAAGSTIERHPTAKLHSDGTLAVDGAIARGADEIVILAGTGGRLDHTLTTIHLLRRGADRGVRMRAIAHGGRLWTVTPRSPLELHLAIGTVLSILPLTDAATGVTLDGLRWPLRDATMTSGDPYGVSNETTHPCVRIACTSGVLAAVEPTRTGDETAGRG